MIGALAPAAERVCAPPADGGGFGFCQQCAVRQLIKVKCRWRRPAAETASRAARLGRAVGGFCDLLLGLAQLLRRLSRLLLFLLLLLLLLQRSGKSGFDGALKGVRDLGAE